MSTSAYSTPNQSYDVGGFESVDYIGTVQHALQNKIDLNKEKVNEVLKQFGNVDLIRPEDKEAFMNKLKGIVGYMNGSNGLDFRDNSLASSIDAELHKAFDKETMTQINNTRSIRNYTAAVEAKKTEGKGKYNQVNDWFAKKQAGLDAYMKGETNELGTLNYEDYVDVYGTLQKDVQKWVKEIGMEKGVQVGEQGSDIMSIIKTNSVKAEKLRSFIQGQLDNRPEYQRQLLMNGAYDYQTVSDEDIQTSYKRGIIQQQEIIRGEVGKMEGEMALLPKDLEKVKMYQESINNYNNQIEGLETRKDLKVNRTQQEYNLATERIIDSLVTTNQKFEITSVDYNDVYSRVRSRNYRDQLAAETLNLAQKKYELAASKAAGKTKDDLLGLSVSTLDIGKEDANIAEATKSYAEARHEKAEQMAIAIQELEKAKGNDITIEKARNIFTGIVNNPGNVVDFATDVPDYIINEAHIQKLYIENTNRVAKENMEHFLNEGQKDIFDSIVKDKAKGVSMNNLEKFNPELVNKLNWAIENGKTYDDLSQDDKVILAAEAIRIHRNSRRSGEDPSDRSSSGYINTEYLMKAYPYLQEKILSVGKGKDNTVVGSAASAWWGAAKIFGRSAFDSLGRFKMLYNPEGDKRDRSEVARKNTEDIKGIKQSFKNMGLAARTFGRGDSGTTQLDLTDLGGPTDTYNTLFKRYRDITSQSMQDNADKYSDEYGKLKHQREVGLDPKIASNSVKAAYSELSTLMAQQGMGVPSGAKIFLKQDTQGNGYQARYISVNNKGETISSEPVFLKGEDAVKISNFMARTSDMGNSESIMRTKKTAFSVPSDAGERSRINNILYQQDPNMWNKDNLEGVVNGLEDKEFYMKQIRGVVKDPDLLGKVDYILGRQYYTRLGSYLGSDQIYIYGDTDNNSKPLSTTNYKVGEISSLTPTTYKSIVPSAVQEYILKALNDVVVDQYNKDKNKQ